MKTQEVKAEFGSAAGGAHRTSTSSFLASVTTLVVRRPTENVIYASTGTASNGHRPTNCHPPSEGPRNVTSYCYKLERIISALHKFGRKCALGIDFKFCCLHLQVVAFPE